MLARLNLNRIIEASSLLALLCTTILVYGPGLDSRFVLDDFYNLKDLDDVYTSGYLEFIFKSGFAGPTGRPLSLLTFALQYESWPANPFAFKLINLVLHLINGVIIFFICRLLSGLIFSSNTQRQLFCLATTGFWLLHPIQLTTTLYVIQRMTQISALFSLLGLLGYLHFRLRVNTVDNIKQYLILSVIVWFATCLALLSKENGVLLPLLILVTECTLLINHPRPPSWNKWLAVVLVLPMVILCITLLAGINETLSGYAIRDFSLIERLLTQPRVLLEYFKNLIIPVPSAFGLYHDDFVISRGPLDPPSTIISILILLTVIIPSICFRKRLPVVSFSVLWFFAGHILESSFLNLEL